jgi:hypothetical protein
MIGRSKQRDGWTWGGRGLRQELRKIREVLVFDAKAQRRKEEEKILVLGFIRPTFSMTKAAVFNDGIVKMLAADVGEQAVDRGACRSAIRLRLDIVSSSLPPRSDFPLRSGLVALVA